MAKIGVMSFAHMHALSYAACVWNNSISKLASST